MNRYLPLVSSLFLIGCISAYAEERAHLPPSYNPEQASNAFRTPETPQITRFQEANVFSGSGNTSSLPANYRDVPDIRDSSTVNTVRISSTQHNQMLNCGVPGEMTGSNLNPELITHRIKHCAMLNPTVATWDVSVKGRGGESVWKLVSRVKTTVADSTTNREVWQDQRTGLLWSSKPDVTRGLKGDQNWCGSVGNDDSNDPFALCTVNTSSYCSESLYPSGQPANPGQAFLDEGENYQTGVYSNSKGQMGLKSRPSVKWRLPTRNDYMQAEIDGIRYVMPDMLSAQTADELTATVVSKNRSLSWVYSVPGGHVKYYDSSLNRKTFNLAARCVGR